MSEPLEIRVYGSDRRETLVYLPGLHGDWTLIPSFRALAATRFLFVELVYPRTLEWSLAEYATSVLEALESKGISSGWLLGESFGSQVLWEMLRTGNSRASFRIEGVILVGGFVRYPFPKLVDLAIWLLGRTSRSTLDRCLRVWATYARVRFRHSPETRDSLAEFIDRRTEDDVRAVIHRLHLIRENDPRDVARATRLPVYLLSGLLDPIVFQPLVRFWLENHCPGFRGAHTISQADHTLLATEPSPAFKQIVHWIDQERSFVKPIM